MKLYTVLLACLLTTSLVASERKTEEVTVESAAPEKKEEASTAQQTSQQSMEVLDLAVSQGESRVTAKFVLRAHQAGKVSVVWMNGDRIYATIPMNVKAASPKWHGHADIRALAGEWKVQITDESGKVLSEKSFAVVPSSSQGSSESSQSQSGKGEKDASGIKKVLTTLEPEKVQETEK